MNHVPSEENNKIISDSKLKISDINEKCLLNPNQKHENLLNNNEEIHNSEFVEKNIMLSKKESVKALPDSQIIAISSKSNINVNEKEILEDSRFGVKNGNQGGLSDKDKLVMDSENKNIIKEIKGEEEIKNQQGIFHINKNSFFLFLISNF